MVPSNRRWAGLCAVVLALVVGVLGCSQPPSSQPAPRVEASGQRWSLAFKDTFDGPGLDTSKWVTCYWWGDKGCTNSGNRELQWYQRRNVSVSNGHLRLTARRERVLASDGQKYEYTSGMVTTGRRRDVTSRPPRFATRYGRIEARIKMPGGRGLWPAFWLLPITHSSRPETDIVEVLGHRPRRLHFHVHVWDDGERLDPGRTVRGVDSRRWHRYAVEWSPTSLTWLVDGVPRWRLRDEVLIAQEPQYLLLNLAVGGVWAGPPGRRTKFPATMLVDHVRVWSYDAGAGS